MPYVIQEDQIQSLSTVWGNADLFISYVSHSSVLIAIMKGLIAATHNYCVLYTVKAGYNDVGLCDTSPIASDILWYELIPHYVPGLWSRYTKLPTPTLQFLNADSNSFIKAQYVLIMVTL
jgi:hypothetical protein